MKQTDNIYLIGLMGAGKTTIGRQLAKVLQLPFYDSDKAIEEQTGVIGENHRIRSIHLKLYQLWIQEARKGFGEYTKQGNPFS